MTFGLIVIGALIVPTSDIVRFILLITGSDRTYAEFYQRESPKRIRFDANLGAKKADNKCQIDLVDDIILYRIENRLRKADLIKPDNERMPQESPKPGTETLHEVITEELIGYMARESITNVVARGAADTLQAIASDDGLAFQTAFQDADGIREHVVSRIRRMTRQFQPRQARFSYNNQHVIPDRMRPPWRIQRVNQLSAL